MEDLEELEELIKKYNIKNLDKDICTKLSNVRRPLVLVRGKPVTVSQAMEVITGEEPLFREGSDDKNCWFDPRSERGPLKNIFYRQGYTWLSTWLYSDGTIGGNLIHLGKYPELDEILWNYEGLAEKYPFLDMVVSYTLLNECCCGWCRKIDSSDMKEEDPSRKDCRDCEPYLDKIRLYQDFHIRMEEKEGSEFEKLYYGNWGVDHVRSDVQEFVCLTIWIHNGHTEVLFGEEAKETFSRYNTLYCEPEYEAMFGSFLYRYGHTCICDKKFVEDCFAYIGKPKSLCDEYVERRFISPFPEDAVVITKDWVTHQYQTYIADR